MKPVIATTSCILGFRQLQISCIIGLYPHEREAEQILRVDLKIKLDITKCLQTCKIEDTVDYVHIAKLCSDLAINKRYYLLETMASDVLDECFRCFNIDWAWISLHKPAAIPMASYGFIEIERSRSEYKNNQNNLK